VESSVVGPSAVEPAAVKRATAESSVARQPAPEQYAAGQPETEPVTGPVWLDLPIKEIIERYPEVGNVLSTFGVGCVDCTVGSCLLRDIVSIHDLSTEDEEALLERLSVILSPGRPLRITSSARTGEPGAAVRPKQSGGQAATPSYSPPVRQLVQEHVLIMRWVNLVPRLLRVIDLAECEHRGWIRQGIDFIRSYADHFHHAKEEEDILFNYFDEGKDIIQVMLSEHETARAHVRAAEAALTAGDLQGVTDHLQAYAELLAEHISKEDDILYPWMDRQLSTGQVGEMFRRFAEVDSTADAGTTHTVGLQGVSVRQDAADSPEAAPSHEGQGLPGSRFTQRCTQLIADIEEFVARREESEGGV